MRAIVVVDDLLQRRAVRAFGHLIRVIILSALIREVVSRARHRAVRISFLNRGIRSVGQARVGDACNRVARGNIDFLTGIVSVGNRIERLVTFVDARAVVLLERGIGLIGHAGEKHLGEIAVGVEILLFSGVGLALDVREEEFVADKCVGEIVIGLVRRIAGSAGNASEIILGPRVNAANVVVFIGRKRLKRHAGKYLGRQTVVGVDADRETGVGLPSDPGVVCRRAL